MAESFSILVNFGETYLFKKLSKLQTGETKTNPCPETWQLNYWKPKTIKKFLKAARENDAFFIGQQWVKWQDFSS